MTTLHIPVVDPLSISVVIPIYNEALSLPALFARLYPALDAISQSYEIIFINDGSSDQSAAILRQQFQKRPEVTRVILLAHNCGQHNAILAGFAQTRGQLIITLDADLQNPPEEIPKLIVAAQAGHDYVGTIRKQRQDTLFRRYASRLMNRLRERITYIRITDQGCMLRAYSKEIVDAINQCRDVSTFIPALAYTFACHPTEIEVAHEDRVAGESKYSLFSLMRLNFDLMTGFSIVPLQWVSMIGFGVAMGSFIFTAYLGIRRLFLVGPEAEGVFTLMGIAFFLIGVILLSIGLLGEYVGRIYEQVRMRPRYLVEAILEKTP